MTFAAYLPWLIVLGPLLGTALVLAVMVLCGRRERCALLHRRYHERLGEEPMAGDLHRVYYWCLYCDRDWHRDERILTRTVHPPEN